MSLITLNTFLKQKNLWPSQKEESWKYFDFKNFELLTKNSTLRSEDFNISYSSEHHDEIRISAHSVEISENLKKTIEASIVSNSSILNKRTNLDLRLTTFNLEKKGLLLKIENQDSLNIKLVYEAHDNHQALIHFVRFDLNNVDLTLFEDNKVKSMTSLLSTHFQMTLVKSHVEHVTLFSNHYNANQILETARIYNSEIKVKEESSYKNTSILLKNKLLRVQQTVSLEAKGASGFLNAFNISENKNFSELRTEILHIEPKTESRQLFKTIASDEAKSIFNGRIFVRDEAQKTDASQLCQGILLSPKAEINAKPELEIYADDVKAAHGAAIGQLGRDQVFYLVSRGIKPETAYKMLSKAFAGEVLASIENQNLRDLCQKIIDESSKIIFEKLAESITEVGTHS